MSADTDTPDDPYAESELLKHFDVEAPLADTLKKLAKIGVTTLELLHQLFNILR